MCGRFTLRTPPSAWCQLFLIDTGPTAEDTSGKGWRPRYNIAPTQSVAAIVQDQPGAERRVTSFRWGLLPPWAKELSIGARMINARSETVDEKPSFRKAFAERRCLIPADGYIEWKREADGKQPYLAHRPDDAHRPDHGVFALAGLYERNQRATGEWIATCTILTTSPNQVTGQIHDRMPVVLPAEEYTRWLDPAYRNTDALKPLLIAPNDDFFEITAVSRRVNNARNDDPECLQPMTE